MLWLISQCSARIAEDGGMDGGEDNQFYVEINLGFQIKNFTMFNGDFFFFSEYLFALGYNSFK